MPFFASTFGAVLAKKWRNFAFFVDADFKHWTLIGTVDSLKCGFH